jgi:hypothetical protein
MRLSLKKFIILFFLSSIAFATDSTSDPNTQLEIVMESLLSRESTMGYTPVNTTDPTIPRVSFVHDFFDFFKYYKIREDEKEAYFYLMKPPSLTDFLTAYSSANETKILSPTFTYYQTTNDADNSINNNYLKDYTSYQQFFKKNIIDPTTVSSPIDLTSFSLPRKGDLATTDRIEEDEQIFTMSTNGHVIRHFTYYCPEGYNEICEKIVEKAGGSSNDMTSSTSFHDADVNPESLLSIMGFEPSKSEYMASWDFIRNISNPRPKNVVSFKLDKSSTATNQYTYDIKNLTSISNNVIDQSFRNLSTHVLADIQRRRILASSTDGNTQNVYSAVQYLEYLCTHRMLQNNNWVIEMNSSSSEALLRELVLIQATSLMLEYQKFRQNENMEALVAALVAQNQNLLSAAQSMVSSSKSSNAMKAF